MRVANIIMNRQRVDEILRLALPSTILNEAKSISVQNRSNKMKIWDTIYKTLLNKHSLSFRCPKVNELTMLRVDQAPDLYTMYISSIQSRSWFKSGVFLKVQVLPSCNLIERSRELFAIRKAAMTDRSLELAPTLIVTSRDNRLQIRQIPNRSLSAIGCQWRWVVGRWHRRGRWVSWAPDPSWRPTDPRKARERSVAVGASLLGYLGPCKWLRLRIPKSWCPLSSLWRSLGPDNAFGATWPGRRRSSRSAKDSWRDVDVRWTAQDRSRIRGGNEDR